MKNEARLRELRAKFPRIHAEPRAWSRPLTQSPQPLYHGGTFTDNLEATGLIEVEPREYRYVRDESGWYCDEFQHETITAKVARLPHGRGFVGYLEWSDRDGILILQSLVRGDNPRNAWRLANSLAESIPYDECVYSERWNRAQRAADDASAARDTIRNARAEFRNLARELRTVSLPPYICATMRNTMQTLRRDVRVSVATIRDARKTIADCGDAGEEFAA